MMLILQLLSTCLSLYFIPQYQSNQACLNYLPIGNSARTAIFSPVFTNIPQVILTIQELDKDGGVGTYYIYPSSVTSSTLIITISSSQMITGICYSWMAFLDDNVFGQVGQINQIFQGGQFSIQIPFSNQLTYTPHAAFFLNGVSQNLTPASDKFQYWFSYSAVTQSYIQLYISLWAGYGITQFWYSVIYGLPQYLETSEHDYYSLGPISLFSTDSRTKLCLVSITAIAGSNDIRIELVGSLGTISVNTWYTTTLLHYVLIYFKYLPCPLYCTTCYVASPNCDGCLSSTYRTGNSCTQCQDHMFLIAGQMNCQQCGPYCNECSGSATNCIDCLTSTHRINPPSCSACPSQMFIQSGINDCQQCASYCNECVISSTSCSNCQVSTYRTLPPNCTTCPTNMFIQANLDNCQQCSIYCNECSTSATNCLSCNAITLRITPPSCSQCPINMFIQSGLQNCQQCGIFCGSCTISANNCTICLASTFRISPPNCASCLSQHYLVPNVINCQQCATYCNECAQTADHCSACLISSLRTNPPDCNNCPAQYYVVSNVQNCQQCPTYCNNCQNFTSFCLACSPNSLRLNPPNCMDCPSFTYLNGNTCSSCDSTCQTCNSQKCLSCLANQYINSFGKCLNCPTHCLTCDSNACYTCAGNCMACSYSTCTKCISDNYYMLGTDCYLCPINCLTCNSQSCLTCIGPRIPVNNQCECQSPCLTCDSNQCLSCISPEYRIQQLICAFCPLKCVACDLLGNCYMEPQHCQLGIYINTSIIQCTQCQSNYYLHNNICIQCAPQCLECNHQPQICKICRFPSLGQSECLLCESQIGLYSNYETNTCDSICGDGLITENEECDDGNTTPLDGCSNCQIDAGYYCKGINCQLIQYPIPSISQDLTLDTVYNPVKQFQLTYNIPIIIQIENLQILIPNNSEFTYDIIVIDNKQCNISINLSEQLLGSSIQLIFLNTSEITSDEGFKQQIQMLESQITDYVMINPTDQQISDSTNAIMLYIFIILAVIICLALLFGGLELFWNLLDLLQVMAYLKYVNTIKPYYLYTFLDLFNFLQFQNLPINKLVNIQQVLQDHINLDQFNKPPPLIQNDGFTSSTILNIMPLINVMITGISVYLFAQILLSLIYGSLWFLDLNQLLRNIKLMNLIYQLKYYLIRTCDNIIKSFIWSGLIRIFISSAYDICFTICLGLYGKQIRNYSYIVKIDLSITIFLTLTYLLVTLLISGIASYQSKTLKLKENEYGALFEGLKLRGPFNQQYNALLLIKKFYFMIFLVLLYNEPLFQIFNIILIQVFQLLILVIMNPLANKQEKRKQVISESLMFVAEVALAILIYDDYWTLFSYEHRRVFGWICLFALVIIIVTQLCFDAHQQVQKYYKQFPMIRRLVQRFKAIISKQPISKTCIEDIMI